MTAPVQDAPETAPARPVLYLPEDVGGTVAWDCLVRDGGLVPVHGRAARPATTPDSTEIRMRAVSPFVPGSTIVAGPTAAWVHVGGVSPRTLHVVHRSGTHRPRAPQGVRVRQAMLLADDLATVGGHQLTSVQRTGLDVARHEPAAHAVETIVALTALGFDVRRARLQLERRLRVTGREAAHRTLDAVERRLRAAPARPVTPGAAAPPLPGRP
ncbi:hypothetical protein [Luteimicrobium subarcticum]|uniref:hypothetical protein n=1 Tax=Luteimicrobium subarcticum TaxID=620910 RepID=UPI000C25162D|nr:hypothetical protein [Luteimicrobium subarcticum]